MPAVDPPDSSAPAFGDGAFLPLTLSTIRAAPAAGELGSLADRARRAEAAAVVSWQALLGDCACAQRRRFPDHLRELSEAAGAYFSATFSTTSSATTAGGDRWRASALRARVSEFERWAADALAEGDGEEFAEACAGYDAALARALATAADRAGGTAN
ncbi:MAG: sugar ABC transporter substrate-binding protein [Pseudonocardia sp.]|nr:sugar ABC transporter substrate-binding protein [Pseudonocardia sp.]